MKQGFVPKVGRQFGFIYPIAHRVLDLTWWPSFYRLAKGNRIVVDSYVTAWFLVEIIVAVLLSIGGVISPATVIIPVILLIYRICDMLLVVLYSLTRSAHKQDADWASRNRTVILSFINLFEVFLIFALLYSLLPRDSFNQDISGNIMDCLYFRSVAAGITLGLGDIYPIVTTAKVLCMVQPILILTVLLTMISYARGSHADKTYEEKQIKDLRRNDDQPK